MSNNKISFMRPFGPSIAKIKIPEEIIISLNNYIDEIIIDEKKSSTLDHGEKLAGNVKQEITVKENQLKSSGLLEFLGKSVSQWIEASDKKKITEIRIDDDQDSVWLTVDIGDGSSCHVGYRSCFYRSIPLGPIQNGREVEMKFEEKEKSFDPDIVYKGQPNPTKI